jgi:hypothetical protein
MESLLCGLGEVQVEIVQKFFIETWLFWKVAK